MVKKKTNKKSERKKSKDYYEVFEIGKDNKEKIVKSKEIIEDKEPSKDQVKNENRILRNVLLTIGLIILVIGFYLLLSYKLHFFEYRGVKFEKVNEVAPYKTTFPVIYNPNTQSYAIYFGNKTSSVRDYNIYLRNDPRSLDSIKFNGSMNLISNMVINATGNLSCGGDGIIAVGNFVNFYKLLGVNIFKNESLKCDDPKNNYTFVQIEEGNQTKIEQTGWSCYKIEINNCEILKGTERFLIESFVNVNELIREKTR